MGRGAKVTITNNSKYVLFTTVPKHEGMWTDGKEGSDFLPLIGEVKPGETRPANKPQYLEAKGKTFSSSSFTISIIPQSTEVEFVVTFKANLFRWKSDTMQIYFKPLVLDVRITEGNQDRIELIISEDEN